MWSVVVEEKGSRRELARYTYETKEEAKEAQKNVREVRIDQNHERVWVRLVQHD
jgi:hypothetical protein